MPILEAERIDDFEEDSERPGVGARALAHGTRNLGRYALGGLGVAAGGLAAKQAGRVAGRVRTKADDPQYDTNFRTGQAQFYSRMRDNQRKRQEEDLDEVERLIPAAAIGLGGAHIANKFHSGYRQGQSEKRHSAISKGFDDAWRKTYGKNRNKEEMVEYQDQDNFEEDSLTEIAGAIRAAASRFKPKLGTKTRAALGAGAVGAAGLGAVGAYQGAKGVKAFGKKVVEGDEGTEDGFDEDQITENRALYRVSRSVRGKGATGELHREINRLAAADSYHRGIPFSNRSGPGRPRTTYNSKSVPRKFQSRGVRQESDDFAEDTGSVHMEGCGCPSCKMKEEDLQEGIGRVAGEGLKWGGRSLAALDIGVLGAQGAKAIATRNKNKQNEEDDGFDQDELTERLSRDDAKLIATGVGTLGIPTALAYGGSRYLARKNKQSEESDGFDEDELAERFKGQSARAAVEFGAKHSGKVDTGLFGAGTINSARNKAMDIEDDRKLNSSYLRRK